jgi:hypothetical protein
MLNSEKKGLLLPRMSPSSTDARKQTPEDGPVNLVFSGGGTWPKVTWLLREQNLCYKGSGADCQPRALSASLT